MKPVYLDYNATTPVDSAVADAMMPYLSEHFGNPSSAHWYGLQTRKAIETARKQVAHFIGCKTDEIIFTSGGSESNNLAIKGYCLAHRSGGNHIITSAIEHPAVLKVCKYLSDFGFKITVLPVDEFGCVAPHSLKKSIRPETILVSIMHANNEVGTIQPIKELCAIAHEKDIVFHTDAAQSAGKISVNVNDLGVDLLSIAGHKLYGPKGIGALYVRRGIALLRQIDGADHERNLRAGTENVLEIAGLGKACEIASASLHENQAYMMKMRDRLHESLRENLGEIKLNGHPDNRLPNTLNISFKGLEANTVLSELQDVAASAGAACHSDDISISPVLEAMGVPTEWAIGTIRFSVGKMTTDDDIQRAIDSICRTVRRLRGDSERIHPEKESETRLTQFTHGLGCACKLRPEALEKVLMKIPGPEDNRILVGTETADDAAVYQIDDDQAIVQTVDFFTPIVDDPFHFGAIAAANALSDIYAMGGQPLFAVNIVAFPSNRLPLDVLERILLGASDKAAEAGIFIIGGHTVDDTEPKYGMAVTGMVHPKKIWKNKGARQGDVLILTKPIGVGIITTGIKRGLANRETIERAINVMASLNKAAARVAAQFDVHACTDITGYGLFGHALEMARASDVSFSLYPDKVPVLPEAWDLAAAGAVPGGTRANLNYVTPFLDCDSGESEITRLILADAQTSGGLLMAIPEAQSQAALTALQEAAVSEAAIIGKVISKAKKQIIIAKNY